MAHAGVHAVEFKVQADRLGDALQVEVALEHIAVTVHTHARRSEVGGGEVVDVEEIGRLDVRVALLVVGVDRVDCDLGRYRRSAVVADNDRAAEVFEVASHLAHHQVAYGETDRRVNRVDGPRPGAELSGSGRIKGRSHVNFLHVGAPASPAPPSTKRTTVRNYSRQSRASVKMRQISKWCVTRRAVCATSSISNHAPPLTERRKS